MPFISLPRIVHAQTPERLLQLVEDTSAQILNRDEEKIALFEPYYSVDLDCYLGLISASDRDSKISAGRLYSVMRIRNEVIAKLDLASRWPAAFTQIRTDNEKLSDLIFVRGQWQQTERDTPLGEEEGPIKFIAMVIPKEECPFPEENGSQPLGVAIINEATDTARLYLCHTSKSVFELDRKIPEFSSRNDDWLCSNLLDQTVKKLSFVKGTENVRETLMQLTSPLQQADSETTGPVPSV